MFRPLTFITLAMACGSGLYLYQVKHQAQVLDRQIERTVKATDATRAQARELNAAWTLLGNPGRLQQLADQFLTIQPVQPSQFVALADLDARLPAPRPLDATPVTPPDDAGDADALVAATEPPQQPVGTPPALTPTEPSKPPVVAARPAERKPAEAPRQAHEPAQAQTRPAPSRPAPQPVVAELERPTAPPRPAAAPPPAPAPIGGSLLGMAHVGTSALPPPRPLPVSASPAGGLGN